MSLKSVHARAQRMLNQLKPFDVWVATATKNQLDAATRLWGSPQASYDAIRNEALEIIRIIEKRIRSGQKN